MLQRKKLPLLIKSHSSLAFVQIVVHLIALCHFTQVNAQQEYLNVIPPSPSAASIHQYSSNVSLYTGQLDLKIPIYTIQSGDLTFPIDLSYKGSQGIRVQEVASWVGLGWNLNANSAVSRTIRGLADDHQWGWLNQPNMIIPDHPLNTVDRFSDWHLFEEMREQRVDGEPDIYYYNAPGISGQFYILKSGEIFQVPMTGRRITFEKNLTQQKIREEIKSFTVTDEKGVSYTFSAVEETKAYIIAPGAVVPPDPFSYHPTSWYLTSIKSLNEDDVINFFYESTLIENISQRGAVKIIDWPARGYYQSIYKGKRLTRIESNGTEVIFNTGKERCDYLRDKYLDNIEVRINGLSHKKFQFYYSYNNGESGTDVICNPTYQYARRLMLDSLVEIGQSGTASIPPYIFTYNSLNLPDRVNSYSIDHWGFYNGKHNTTLEAAYFVKLLEFFGEDDGYRFFGSANRNADIDYAKASVLTEIQYPTGGTSTFDYELHNVNNAEISLTGEIKHDYILQDREALTNINFPEKPSNDVKIIYNGNILTETCNVWVHYENVETGATGTLSLYDPYQQANKTTHTIFIPNGTYRWHLTLWQPTAGCLGDSESIMVTVQWSNSMSENFRIAGGLRIKSSTDSDGKGKSIVKSYNYKFADGVTSSGHLCTVPMYGYAFISRLPGGVVNDISKKPIWSRRVSTLIPLASTFGSYVGYSRVEVITNAEEPLGKSVYYYIDPKQVPDVAFDVVNGGIRYEKGYNNWLGETYPFVGSGVLNSNDWIRGKIRAEVYYAYVNGTLTKIKDVKYLYKINFFDEGFPTTRNFVTPDNHDPYFDETEIVTTNNGLKKFTSVKKADNNFEFSYDTFTGRIDLTDKIERSYLESAEKFVQHHTAYTYDNDKPVLTKEEVNKGDVQSRVNEYNYVFQKSTLSDLSINEQQALNSLINKNALYLPVETKVFENETLISRTKNSYEIVNDKPRLKSKFSAYSLESPLLNELEVLEYNNTGQPTLIREKSGITVRYIYDSFKNLITAIKQPQDGFYINSFEHDGSGTTEENPYTGTKVKSLSAGFIIPVSDLISGSSYVLSYYWRSGPTDLWQLQVESIINFQGQSIVTSKTAGQIDELRLCGTLTSPISYYYDEYNRLTAVCDQNSKVIRYRYDELGRLQGIQDEQRNELKRYDYGYYKK
ncbi:RHS repeat protein [Chryseosolibacter indicus]|uniref:YD repeat-containing protein n=1 Tax=Chryseosolibacter indicus TaxID=2782351 RepID=A0ABS5VS79_9BACT|nr:RHS repeat domain-containing protein [Chryseosolibacter indicus]MBT1703724.1 hypothetical protein [Chryseosolibacter indicus]